MQFINNFRGIAILLVILVHALSSVKQGDSTVLFLLSSLLENCTILFVVVAGYLFSYQVDSFNYKNFLLSKIKTVIIPYIVISLPAALLYILSLKTNHFWVDMEWFSIQNPFIQYGYLMITGAHLGPLWFIPMIIVFYLISPLIIVIKNHQKLLLAFSLSLLPAYYYGRPEFNENILQASLYFLPSYLLGLIIAGNSQIYKQLQSKSAIIFVLFIISYLFIASYAELTSSIDLILKMLLAIVVLSLCSEYLHKKNKILDMFARLSFFLFFIHGYFAGVIRTLYTKNILQFEGGIAVILSFVFIVLMSLIAFVVIKLVFKRKSIKWLGI